MGSAGKQMSHNTHGVHLTHCGYGGKKGQQPTQNALKRTILQAMDDNKKSMQHRGTSRFGYEDPEIRGVLPKRHSVTQRLKLDQNENQIKLAM